MARGKYKEWLEPDNLLRVTGWLRDGYTDKEVAENFMGISETTFYCWAQSYPEFSKAVKKGKAPIAEKIENTFYSRCDFQDYEEVTEEIVEKGDGTKERHIKRVKKKLPPSDACLIFALKNLKKSKWQDRPVPDADSNKLLADVKELLQGVESAVD